MNFLLNGKEANHLSDEESLYAFTCVPNFFDVIIIRSNGVYSLWLLWLHIFQICFIIFQIKFLRTKINCYTDISVLDYSFILCFSYSGDLKYKNFLNYLLHSISKTYYFQVHQWIGRSAYNLAALARRIFYPQIGILWKLEITHQQMQHTFTATFPSTIWTNGALTN